MPKLPKEVESSFSKEVENLFSVETSDPRNVALYLYDVGNPGFRELWPELPEPAPFRILGEQVVYDLQRVWLDETAAVREQRQSDWARAHGEWAHRHGAHILGDPRLGEFDPLLPFGQYCRWPTLVLSDRALALLLPLAERLERRIGADHALGLPEGTPIARRLECLLVHFAQTELRAIWGRIERRDWPTDQTEQFFAMGEELGTLYNRAQARWHTVKHERPDGRGFDIHPFPLVEPGLPHCYWAVARIYEHAYRSGLKQGPTCPYCGRAPEGARRADAQHCGRPECGRQWERDRKWLQRHYNDAAATYCQRTGQSSAYGVHPALLRRYHDEALKPPAPPVSDRP